MTLDSEPTYQHTGKPIIPTTLAIRLVLDRASSTKEAIALLKQYDMMATSGRDYHFYITDASGDGRVVEYDCCDASRPLVATPLRSITNFYGMYKEKVKPYQTNGIYGHGKNAMMRWKNLCVANKFHQRYCLASPASCFSSTKSRRHHQQYPMVDRL